ncbi:helix-turn-helix domain-containing protein [Flavobacterium kingsejongi]|uniref:Transcriptional regulator n=1 Tax=Flavobacterium kingsejongi TaxID=1678728 RepID=A0A2S1LJK5_9FLAO|nr:helix-turn-helix transcriptional regulator [Flavobacterium kingsejongi]AWG23917.1 transcriptional regulator [Flavobacterium kingsejongi]
MTNPVTPPHYIGRKISRIREMRGINQDTLAIKLGTSQQSVSRMEQSEEIDEEKLVEIAKILGVTPEAIKNYSEEAAINYFNDIHDNTVTGGSSNAWNIGTANNSTFNPLEKLIEMVDENKKLYERLLQSEQDKIAYLEQLLKNK